MLYEAWAIEFSPHLDFGHDKKYQETLIYYIILASCGKKDN